MALTNLTTTIDRRSRFPQNKLRRRLVIPIVLILLLLIIPSVFVFINLGGVAKSGKGAVEAYKNQNFDLLRQEINSTKNSLGRVNFSLNFLFWLKIIPFLGGYYSDVKGFTAAGVEELIAVEKLLQDLDPHKAELGFNNNPKSGPERVTQVVKIIDKSLNNLDKVEGNLAKASEYVKNIDIEKYPETFRGKEVKRNLRVLKDFIMGAAIVIKDDREIIKVAPAVLGEPAAKTYLLLFQNDKEIRPTGGFLTAFATLRLEHGQVSSTTSDDIYRLDEKLLSVCLSKICPLTPPAPIVKYLPEFDGKPRKAWSMRDSNLSPDLPTAAAEFERIYQLLGEGLPFDGIIYIDTFVVEEFIKITGPIDVFGTSYSAEIDKRCNCPNVIYELESYAEIAAKGEGDRKAILGVLMQQILARSIGAEVEKLPQLVDSIAKLANEKHIMFYMHDIEVQQALSKLNWTGEIKNYNGDYLHINDSNFAGGKSNLYVEQTVLQEITTQNGETKKKITIEYKNPQEFNSWLNGINRDYVRFFVPKGSKLISSKGSEENVNTTDDLDKTVFEAFIQVRPKNSRKLEIEYTIPYQPKDKYQLLIQKQPGAKDFKHKIKLNGKNVSDFELEVDKEFSFPL